ncbi:hypothetical protein C1H46_043053 [Malus baccata]|uniref:Uncharacterized protein n=1 Tax=Malus baccata TaxID=106549 RepID=A0A540KB08_MALBA|nr:hypothetical protein C1H46_043053 [Malus baccata]
MTTPSDADDLESESAEESSLAALLKSFGGGEGFETGEERRWFGTTGGDGDHLNSDEELGKAEISIDEN